MNANCLGTTGPTDGTVSVAAPIAAARTAVTDVSASTGRTIAGPVTAWTTGGGADTVEHVAACDAAGKLVVFYRSRDSGGWRAVDASGEAGRSLAGASGLTSWVSTDGEFTVEHVAGRGAGNVLLVFYWSPRHGRWRVVDATAEAGSRVAGGVTSWLTRSGANTVEHVAGVSPEGRLVVFWWSPAAGRWKSVDASEEAGRSLAGPNTLTSWVSTDGEFTVEHVAGRGAGNVLLVFYWSPRHGRWRVVDATAEAGSRVAGGVTSWLTRSGAHTVEHVAGVSPDGNLAVFWWSPVAATWKAVNATRIARGPELAGAPRALAATQSVPEVVVSRGVDGGLQLCWWTSALDWQMADLAATTGSEIVGDPVTWTVPQDSPERVAVCGAGGHLLVFTSDAQEREIVEALRAPVHGVRRTRGVRRKVLTILWDPHKPDRPRPGRAAVEAAVLGAADSVRDYYLENSDGQFTIESAGVLGWYDSDFPPEEYWPPDRSPGRDSGAEAIRKAAATFDFARFDTGDGRVDAAELGVLFVLPGAGDGGGLGRVVGEDYTTRDTARGITVDGKLITWIVEVSIGAPPGPGIVAHELAHLLLGLGDMYFAFGFHNPYAARAYSLMDQDGRAPHLDPASKLKLGWLHPRPVLRAGRYRLSAIETGYGAWALVDPRRGTREYFLVENRWPGTSYDSVLPDRGLGVWHVIEDERTFAGNPPPGVSAANWAKAGGWPRQGIRMIRPVPGPPADDRRALWDGADPETGGDVVLRWADGSPSGFALNDISAAGPVVEATIQVPDTPVPDVRQSRREQARQRVRAAGLVPAFTGEDTAEGWVFTQSPPAGARVAAASTVTMRLRTGPIP